MSVKQWNALNPGEAELAGAWQEWRLAVSLKQELKAAEWRQMYIALLTRKDHLLSQVPSSDRKGRT